MLHSFFIVNLLQLVQVLHVVSWFQHTCVVHVNGTIHKPRTGDMYHFTLVNLYADLLVFTRIAGTS